MAEVAVQFGDTLLLEIMFTGLIAEVGTVLSTSPGDLQPQLEISAPLIAEKANVGDSIAVNGCCLTIAGRQDNRITFDILQETLGCTNLGRLRAGSRVNLEPALSVGARMGGHFVQGHIDCTAEVLALQEHPPDLRLEITLPKKFARYVVFKGSVAINGVSLTVAELSDKSVTTWIIPHTKEGTNIGSLSVNDLVNVEFDMIAKYLERLVEHHCRKITE